VSEPARTDARVPRLDGARARRADWRAWGRTLREHHPDLSPAALHVAKHLALYADAEGRCFPGHDTLVEETGVPQRSLTLVIKELKEAKVIRQEERSGTGRRHADYWLLAHVQGDESLPPRVATDAPNAATQGGSPHARGAGSTNEVPISSPQPPDGGLPHHQQLRLGRAPEPAREDRRSAREKERARVAEVDAERLAAMDRLAAERGVQLP
jgi:hypothetical protein